MHKIGKLEKQRTGSLREGRQKSGGLQIESLLRGRLFSTYSAILVLLMCFGVDAATSGGNDYYYQQQHDYPNGGGNKMNWAMMPMENAMNEPQALRADRMMLKLIMDATTPSASIERSNWRSALNAQQNRNMAWERLGWGW